LSYSTQIFSSQSPGWLDRVPVSADEHPEKIWGWEDMQIFR
jgi:hypothetical protein